MLNIAGVKLGREFYVEYSHHYGIPNFGRTGCILIDCVNREYCKKSWFRSLASRILTIFIG